MKGSNLVSGWSLVIGAAAGLSSVLAPARADEIFAPASWYQTGNRPTFAVIGEVTGDDYPDVLVLSTDSRGLQIFAGSSSGALTPGARFESGPNPDSLALGDFDEDGDADVVIANHETGQVTFLLNNGSGSLARSANSPLRFEVQPHVHAVAARDMDADGHLDVVVDDRGGKGFAFLRGRGNGNFYPQQHTIDAGGDPYLGMAIEDLDGNERPDVVAPLSSAVSIVMNHASGFSAPSKLGGGAFAVTLGDFNGDHRLDIASASERGQFAVHQLSADGAFTLLGQQSVNAGAKRIISGDFNGDGNSDFVLQNYRSPELMLFTGGDSLEAGAALAAGETPWGLAAGDLNADGYDDLVSLDHAADRLVVFLARP